MESRQTRNVHRTFASMREYDVIETTVEQVGEAGFEESKFLFVVNSIHRDEAALYSIFATPIDSRCWRRNTELNENELDEIRILHDVEKEDALISMIFMIKNEVYDQSVCKERSLDESLMLQWGMEDVINTYLNAAGVSKQYFDEEVKGILQTEMEERFGEPETNQQQHIHLMEILGLDTSWYYQ